ncbi:GtrA family protein [Ochrobactrum sp. S1502_03]|uniref:GtrA family protein n=1 Tax=Ochrobactrum sp. S1502_03 TaxID=3108451 RepID=UPI0037C65732
MVRCFNALASYKVDNCILISQLTKYGLVGIVNTTITFVVVAILSGVSFDPYMSNAIGFAAGLLNSYFMNKAFTFNGTPHISGDAIRFMFAFIIAYMINIGVLHFLLSLSSETVVLYQLIAMFTYNIAFFILMKTWVFARD